jgi:hypothetical protein
MYTKLLVALHPPADAHQREGPEGRGLTYPSRRNEEAFTTA